MRFQRAAQSLEEWPDSLTKTVSSEMGVIGRQTESEDVTLCAGERGGAFSCLRAPELSEKKERLLLLTDLPQRLCKMITSHV